MIYSVWIFLGVFALILDIIKSSLTHMPFDLMTREGVKLNYNEVKA